MTEMKQPRANKAPPQTRKELLALHRRVVKKFKALTMEQRFQTIVRAGIYTPDGKLTKAYAG